MNLQRELSNHEWSGGEELACCDSKSSLDGQVCDSLQVEGCNGRSSGGGGGGGDNIDGEDNKVVRKKR